MSRQVRAPYKVLCHPGICPEMFEEHWSLLRHMIVSAHKKATDGEKALILDNAEDLHNRSTNSVLQSCQIAGDWVTPRWISFWLTFIAWDVISLQNGGNSASFGETSGPWEDRIFLWRLITEVSMTQLLSAPLFSCSRYKFMQSLHAFPPLLRFLFSPAAFPWLSTLIHLQSYSCELTVTG